jgi:putative tryptophan/tyrosine transport system substrate-binding protein
MQRRSLLRGAIGAPVCASLAALAQSQQKLPLLAVLSPATRGAAVANLVNAPFRRALAELGYEAGRNIEIAERFAEGDETRLPALAAELVALQPQVLFTNTSAAAVIAARATRTIPIVVGPAGEGVLLELAGGSFARPTTNVTGFALTSPEIDGKCIALLAEAAPAARRIGVLVNPRNPGHRDYPARLQAALGTAKIALSRIESGGLADIDTALTAASAQRIGALFVADDSHIAAVPAVRERVLRFAATARIPVASSHLPFARDGALLAMGPSIPALAAAAAGYVDKILKGAKPGELPVQLPTVLTVTLNMKVAKALDLKVSPALFVRANEVIE